MAEISSPNNISAEVVKIHWLGEKLCVTAGNLYCGFATLTVIATGRVVPNLYLCNLEIYERIMKKPI